MWGLLPAKLLASASKVKRPSSLSVPAPVPSSLPLLLSPSLRRPRPSPHHGQGSPSFLSSFPLFILGPCSFLLYTTSSFQRATVHVILSDLTQAVGDWSVGLEQGWEELLPSDHTLLPVPQQSLYLALDPLSPVPCRAPNLAWPQGSLKSLCLAPGLPIPLYPWPHRRRPDRALNNNMPPDWTHLPPHHVLSSFPFS